MTSPDLDNPVLRARLLATSFVGTLAIGGGLLWFETTPEGEPVAAEPVVEVAPEPVLPQFSEVRHAIARGDTLGAVVSDHGVSNVNAVVDAANAFTDLTNIRAGRELVFVYELGDDGTYGDDAIALRYELDEDNTLLVHLGEAPTAALETVQYETELGVRAMDVEGSLWASAIDAGLRPQDIVRLSEVFQWEVDFNTELRAGARFTLVGEELHHEGEFAKLGELNAVRLENDGETYTAFFYESDASTGWFHADGTASKRPFLRSPLEFSRVTSSFNLKRYHPVLKKGRPHYGTDFGATTGTPVRATGDGLVVTASTNGGHGKYVKLDHAGPYTTSYSHLSKIAVKKGTRVEQGQVIGYVGSTGLSTGPHLHYEFRVDNKPVDAMKARLPSVEPLPDGERARFDIIVDHWAPYLDGELDTGWAMADGE